MRLMMRVSMAAFAVICFSAEADAAGPVAKAIGFWRPRAIVNADPQTIQAGQSSTISWETWNATSAQRDITEWFPYSNGYIIPLQGSMVVSPLVTTTYTVTAFRRGRDLNGDGRADGPRRSFTASVTVTVVPAPVPPGPVPPEPTPLPPIPSPLAQIRGIVIEETGDSTAAWASVRNSKKIRDWCNAGEHVIFFLDKDSAAKSPTFKLWADKAAGKALPYLFVTPAGDNAIVLEVQAPGTVDAFLTLLQSCVAPKPVAKPLPRPRLLSRRR